MDPDVDVSECCSTPDDVRARYEGFIGNSTESDEEPEVGSECCSTPDDVRARYHGFIRDSDDEEPHERGEFGRGVFGDSPPTSRSNTTCVNCPVTLKTNSSLAKRAMQIDLSQVCAMGSWCEKNCRRNCSLSVTFIAMSSFRSQFWGDVPTSKERRSKIAAAIATARENYLRLASVEALDPLDYHGQLLFRAGGKFVCQKYFANLLGMADSNAFKNKVWVNEVNKFVSGAQHTFSKHKRSDKDSARCKRDHAYAHIKKTVESQMMDMSAHVNFDNHLYLPYATKTCFFDEYEYLAKRLVVPIYAKSSTFFTALEEVVRDKKKTENISIRMSTGKGIYCNVLLYSVILCNINFFA